MTLGLAFILILLVAAAIGGISYVRAARLREGGRLHSLPAYHAAHAVLWILAPALLVLAAWTPLQNRLVDEAVLATPEGQALPDFAMQRDTILAEARQIANREIEAGFNPESTAIAPLIKEAEDRYSSIGGVAAILFALGAAGLLFVRKRDRQFRARTSVEKWMTGLLIAASMIAIFTTLGIVLSLLFESLRFFALVPPSEFLFGLTWSPQVAIRADQAGSSGAFGSMKPVMMSTRRP